MNPFIKRYPWLWLVGYCIFSKDLSGCFGQITQVDCGPSPDLYPLSIQITPHFRDYISGPIDGMTTVRKYDPILVYAGELPESPVGTYRLRNWVLFGDVDDRSSICVLQRIYNFGERALFFCPLPGVYVAYTNDVCVPQAEFKILPNPVGFADRSSSFFDTLNTLQYFELSTQFSYASFILSPEVFFAKFKRDTLMTFVNYTQSEPLELIDSDYCYYWNYEIKIKSKVGYVFRESEPLTGVSFGGSYILMEIKVWIVEPSSEKERNTESDTAYSKILTRRFQTKGLLPCLRNTHPAIELSSNIDWIEENKSPKLKMPHWTLEIKVHTDRLVATLSDIEFTISSRQHTALYHCFVGDVRVFVSLHDFDFIDEGQSDRNQINWDITSIPKIHLDYIRDKAQHIYGHGTAYKGTSWDRPYQPGDKRTDAVVINNPCIAQEFAIALAGRIYIIEEFLQNFKSDVIDIILPGTQNEGDEEGTLSDILSQKMYFAVTDMAFIPTHVAILTQNSTVYLHSHSIFYRGFAYLTEIHKFRIGALVKRKWCARTATTKSSNMLIPGFSRRGAIIFIQVFPTEKSNNLWILNSLENCLVKDNDVFTKTYEEVLKSTNETCIHRNEVVIQSDNQGIPVTRDVANCFSQNSDSIFEDESEESNLDGLEKFISNNGKMFPSQDPHFPKELINSAIHRTSNNITHFNLALIYKVDESDNAGEKIKNALKFNGLHLISSDNATELQLHAMEFTAVERKFLICAEFDSKELKASGSGYNFTMMITSLDTVNMAIQNFPSNDIEETLETHILFPGFLLVRSAPYFLTNLEATFPSPCVPFTTKLNVINTAIPTYVINLGNVFVFSSIESKYARPLSYFSRDKIHEIIHNIKFGDDTLPKKLSNDDRQTMFSSPNYSPNDICTATSNIIMDIIVAEQGTVSILKRRTDDTAIGQSVFIGSVFALDSLREVKPFAAHDNILQMATPDGEIVYGKFTTRAFPYFRNCIDSEKIEAALNGYTNKLDTENSCIIQHQRPKLPGDDLPYCMKKESGAEEHEACLSWEVLDGGDRFMSKIGVGGTILIEFGYCDNTAFSIIDKEKNGCILKGKDEGKIPKNFPSKELLDAEMLAVPFSSLLNGNLQLVIEDKITDSKIRSTGPSVKSKENKICPFSNFEVKYMVLNFAEVGFTTRITSVVSYLGINLPSEADLLIEFDYVTGIQVGISSQAIEERDETTLTKTVDINFRLTDEDILRMTKNENLNTDFRYTKNIARELSDIFGITFRPSIVNNHCKKEDFYTTIQYNIGCNPFNTIRLLAEATPVTLKRIQTIETPYNESSSYGKEWIRYGDELIIPRDQVWHKQRKRFQCVNPDSKVCKIPYAYLFNDQVYDLSWRDPFVPQFEQFLTPRVRKVSGNVVVYDLLGSETIMNISQLDAGCYNNGTRPNDSINKVWYERLRDSTQSIGQQTSLREDIYKYHSNCFDTSFMPKEKPKKLSEEFYRLINQTNRNKAVVINTHYNRFTYCQLMDTFFLIRITGIAAPRDGLKFLDVTLILLVLLIFFLILYFIFYKFYTWKLDIPAIPAIEEEERNDGLFGEPAIGHVESDHMMKRLANKVMAIAKWRRKALSKLESMKQSNQNRDKDQTDDGTT